ncbi:MAG: type 1 glutamine amidotransferase [Rhodobacteraceae bacterium]|nr:type 1 glutamine amidotransferase [Paracoccaceae bacterium]
MKIGILQTGHAPEALRGAFGDYPTMFARLLDGHGFDFQAWPVVDGRFPASVHDADGWLLTGSRHGVYDEAPFIPPLMDFIRTACAQGVPLVGICFGHQAIAKALGAEVAKAPGGWEVGARRYDFEGRPLRLNAWHQDQVLSLPPGAEVVASHPACPFAALRYGDRAFSVQAHPEFSDGFIEGLIDTRAPGVVPDDRREAARASLGQGTDAAEVAARIAAFFKQPRGGQ